MKLFKYKQKIVHIKLKKKITIKGNFENTSGKLKKKQQQKETFKIQMENYNRNENLSVHYKCTFYILN